MKSPCVYILACKRDGVIYIGVTSDLAHRMVEHRHGLFPGFTRRYGIKCLVYYEMHATMDDAITREKRLKEWQRAWKVRLIETMNPEWRDLFDAETGEIAGGPLGCGSCQALASNAWILAWVPAFAGMTLSWEAAVADELGSGAVAK